MTRALMFCCVAISGFMGASAPGPISTTRFQVDGSGRIVLPVRVAGASHTFLMDTATRSTTISPAVATTLTRAVRADRHGVRVVDDVSLELLGVVLPHQALQLSNEPMAEDGVVGAELCNRFVVKVDFRTRRITLWERSFSIDTRHAVIVPADFSNEVPAITVRIGAAGARASAATLVVGLRASAGTVSFTYRYAADNGLLDAARDGQLPIDIRGVTKSSLSAVGRLPREPERDAMLFADGIVSARALTGSWIAFDASRGRIVIAQ